MTPENTTPRCSPSYCILWYEHGNKFTALMPPVLIRETGVDYYLCESHDHNRFYICKDHFDPEEYLLARLNYESP